MIKAFVLAAFVAPSDLPATNVVDTDAILQAGFTVSSSDSNVLIGDDEIFFLDPSHECENESRSANVYQSPNGDTALELFENGALSYSLTGPFNYGAMTQQADTYCSLGVVQSPFNLLENEGAEFGLVNPIVPKVLPDGVTLLPLIRNNPI